MVEEFKFCPNCYSVTPHDIIDKIIDKEREETQKVWLCLTCQKWEEEVNYKTDFVQRQFGTLKEGDSFFAGGTEFKKVNPSQGTPIGKHFNSGFHLFSVGEKVLVSLNQEVKTKKPKVICYCGSLRFIEAFKEAEYRSVLDGNIALLPCCMFVDVQREYGVSSDYKKKADKLHKRKIDMADEVHVLNVGGYIGDSTKEEIEYARSLGKPIVYLY